MRKLVLLLALVASSAQAQPFITHPPVYASANLPTCNGDRDGTIISLADASSTTDCDATGGGTTSALCKCTQRTGVFAWEGVLTSGDSVGVTDHGDLTGLDDDDHPQYLTPAEADALYCSLTGTCPPGAHTHDALTAVGTSTLTLSDNGSAAKLQSNKAVAAWVSANGTSEIAVRDSGILTTAFVNDPWSYSEIRADASGRLLFEWSAGATDCLLIGNPSALSPNLTISGGCDFEGNLVGNADTATALAANGANCSAGNYPLGVDASGNAEDCTAAGGGGDNIPDGRAVSGGGTVYWSIPGVACSGVTTFAYAADRTYYEPFKVPTAITLDRIGLRVQSAAAASTTARLGIYNADTSWQPTTLVLDAGTVAVDSTGFKEITISQALPVGRYLAAINFSGGNPTLVAHICEPNAYLTDLSSAIAIAYGSEAIASFPSPGTAWTTVASAIGWYHTIKVRVSTP